MNIWLSKTKFSGAWRRMLEGALASAAWYPSSPRSVVYESFEDDPESIIDLLFDFLDLVCREFHAE